MHLIGQFPFYSGRLQRWHVNSFSDQFDRLGNVHWRQRILLLLLLRKRQFLKIDRKLSFLNFVCVNVFYAYSFAVEIFVHGTRRKIGLPVFSLLKVRINIPSWIICTLVKISVTIVFYDLDFAGWSYSLLFGRARWGWSSYRFNLVYAILYTWHGFSLTILFRVLRQPDWWFNTLHILDCCRILIICIINTICNQ